MNKQYDEAIQVAVNTLKEIAEGKPRTGGGQGISPDVRRAAAVALLDALGQGHVQDVLGYESPPAKVNVS